MAVVVDVVVFGKGIMVAMAVAMDLITAEAIMVAILEDITVTPETGVVAWIVKMSSVVYVATKFAVETVKMSTHAVAT